MNEYIQENKRTLFILTGLLLLLVIVLYFLLLRPLMADFPSQERKLISLENEQVVLTQKIENFHETTKDINVEQLMAENKIPTKRELDEYILSLQQVESISDSKLIDIEFMYDSSLPEKEKEQEEDEGEEVEEESSETDGDEEEELTIDPVIINEKPEELEVLTVRVEGASKDFDDFIDLLKGIEDQERISIVSKLEFNKPTEDEILFSDNPFIALSFTAELTTFYYPD